MLGCYTPVGMIRNYKVNKNPIISGLDSVRTLDQNQKIWEYLKRYQSKQFVQKKLKKEITQNKQLLVTKSQQIASLMIQSEKYYDAAKNAPMEIRPLILYYGMVGLSKCLILTGDNQFTLSALSPNNRNHGHHGLTVSTRDSFDISIRDGHNLANEFCYVHTTPQMTGLYNLLRQCYSNTAIPNGFRITVEDTLSLIPEIYKEYQAYFNQKPRSWKCESGITKLSGVLDNIQLIEFDSWYHITQKIRHNESYAHCILRCFPELRTNYDAQPNTDNRFTLKNNATNIDDYIYVSKLLTREQFALKKFNSFRFSDIDIHFLLMFILSNLVRYRQDKWSRLIRRLDNDQIFLVESFVEISRIKFPYLILRELDNTDYTFLGQLSVFS